MTTDALALAHRPQHAQELADARDQARRSLAALRAVDPATVAADIYACIIQCAATLRDVIEEIERAERKLARRA